MRAKQIKRAYFSFAALLACLTAVALTLEGLGASEAKIPIQSNPVVQYAVKNDLSLPLRSMSPLLPSQRRLPGTLTHSLATSRGPTTASPLFLFLDPALQETAASSAVPSPLRNFEGLANVDSASVPDTEGDVGPNHYVQWINFSFAIYTKTGRLLFGPVPGNTLWRGFGGPCETNNDGDPIVKYDHVADRWLMSQMANESTPFYQCIAISQTPDPMGAFYRYAFLISTTKKHDYSKFAVWPDAYYTSFNESSCDSEGCPFVGEGVAAFERDKMQVGNPNARMVSFEVPYPPDRRLSGTLPSDLNGRLPPQGSPNFFAEVLFPEVYPTTRHLLQIFRFHVDWVNVSASTFSGPTVLDTASFNSFNYELCDSGSCIPQPGTPQKLAVLSDRLMSRLQYRNFGDHESLVANHTVNVASVLTENQAAIRWYELRKSGTNDWTIFQQGTYAPDSNNRWMGSIGMDNAGNIGLGYSISSSTTFPSIGYVGRVAGDPLGTLPQGETELVAGGGSQLTTDKGWGDYSMMSIDPIDDCTFWYTQQYYARTSEIGWQTRIGAFAFPGCVPVLPDFTISVSSDSATIRAGQTATYRLTVTVSNGFSGPISLTCDGFPSSSSCFVSPDSVEFGGTEFATVTVNVVTSARSLLTPDLHQRPIFPGLGMRLLWSSLLLLMSLFMLTSALEGKAAGLRLRFGAGIAGMLFLAILALSCGAGGANLQSGTPPGNYALTVNGSADTLNHNITLHLTVQ